MNKHFYFFLFSLLWITFTSCNTDKETTISLAGNWQFALDPDDKGMDALPFDQTIKLPGSLQNQGFGNDIGLTTKWTGGIQDSSYYKSEIYAPYRQKGNIKVPFWLNPTKHYVGAAWYRHDINIPSNWKGETIYFSMERPHFESTVYLDGNCLGSANSLSTPHQYELKDVDPGKHVLTVKIDNRLVIPVGVNSHSVSDHTQTNWNGIIGSIKLEKRPPIRIDYLTIEPDIKNKKIQVTWNIINTNKNKQEANLNLSCKTLNLEDQIALQARSIKKMIQPGVNIIQMDYAMGNNPLLWDEFHPNVYTLQATLKTKGVVNVKTESFGMRCINKEGRQFTMNGHPIFLRGTLDCCTFPYTGYPSMNKAYWHKIFSQVKAYGLNHVRFHSWCPPEVAFQTADEMGLYLQIECNSWANQGMPIGSDSKLDQWIYDESKAILKAYGNHPSFCFLAYGNEPGGKNHVAYLAKLVDYWRTIDNRRMFTGASGWPYLENADYYCNSHPRIQRWGEGLNSVINKNAPNTTFNFDSIIQSIPIPYVSHEIGQWCVYPNFKEIPKYTGLLKAKNFEIFQQSLKDHDLGDLANDFFMASGKLQTLCYKADIEAALRTPEFAGFQLLGLNDFPGQGTALVGALDPFWDSKAYTTPAEYRTFCNSTVPLAIMKKMIWKASETFKADVQIAHFEESIATSTPIEWKLTNAQNLVIKKGILQADLPINNTINVGSIQADLKSIKKASLLTLTVSIPTLKASNHWHIWIYPSVKINTDKVYVTSSWKKAQQQLNKGKKVMLTLLPKAINNNKGGQIKVGFSSIFWNTAWTNQQPPHTLGIFCDPTQPALANYPTAYHSDYQWWEIMSQCSAMILDDFPLHFKPLIYIIDDWVTNHKTGLAFEAKVGKGSLLVTSVDFKHNLDKRLSAKQLYYSLLEYMNSDKFHPTQVVEADKIKDLL